MRQFFCFIFLIGVLHTPAHAENFDFSKQICLFDFFKKKPFDYDGMHCERLIKSDEVDDKTKAHAYGVLASKYHNEENYWLAYEYYQVSLRMDGSSAAFHRGFSKLNLSVGRYDTAEVHARYALSIEPESFWSHLSVGEIAEVRQNWGEAAEHYKSMTIIKPNRLEGWLAFSRVLKTTKRLTLAKKELLKVYDFAFSGGVFHKKHDLDFALLFDRRISEKEMIVRELAHIEHSLGNYEVGLSLYDTLIEGYPSAQAYLLRAKYLSAIPAGVIENRYERLFQDLTNAASKDPSWTEAQKGLVNYHLTYEDYDKALAVNARYLFYAMKEGNGSKALWNRSSILSAQGDKKAAIEDSKNAVKKAYEDGNYDFLRRVHKRFTLYKFAPDTPMFLENEEHFLDATTACTIVEKCMVLESW